MSGMEVCEDALLAETAAAEQFTSGTREQWHEEGQYERDRFCGSTH